MTLENGTRLGPYEVIEQIGAGGMGEVYRARDPRIDRDVAIKVLPVSFAENEDRLSRFEQEAKAAGSLSHPNLLTIFELGRHEGAPYIVSELLDGETLRDKLKLHARPSRSNSEARDSSTRAISSGATLPLRKVIDYAGQIARGIAAAHEKSVVHRDLKPENVFVTRDGQIKILDFGLAKLTAPDEAGLSEAETLHRRTDPGTVLGTIGYMSPEQVRGLKVDARSDIFSLGTILYEMTTGQRAFEGATAADTMTAILTLDPLEQRGPLSHLSAGMIRTIDHCLEKSPEERFQSARDLAFDLERLLSGSGEQALPSPHQKSKPRTWIWAVALVVIGLVAGFLVGRMVEGGQDVAPVGATPPAFRHLTYSGRDIIPSVSPDGTTIAFTSIRDGSGRIWLKQLKGGTEVPLTNGPSDFGAKFSPDGTSILFVRASSGSSALYRTSILGGQERRVRDDVFLADWSPAGDEIVTGFDPVGDGSRGFEIDIVSADGSNERDVAVIDETNLAGVADLRWSPDGKYLAMIAGPVTGTTSQSVVIFDLESGEKTVSAEFGQTDFLNALAWSGANLVVSRTQQAASHRSEFVLLEVGKGVTKSLFWTLGVTAGFDIAGPNSLVFGMDDQSQGMRTAAIGGGAVTSFGGNWLTRGFSRDRQPVYSPDGSMILFTSTRSGDLDLWTIDHRSGAVRRVTDDDASDWDPAFTPDGEGILWSSNRSGNYEIWMSGIDGSQPRKVSSDGVDAENPTMTPDGEWIVYASSNPAETGIWKVRKDGSDATPLVAGAHVLPEVSPTGEYALYVTASGSALASTISVVSLNDGETVPFQIAIASRVPVNNLGRARWMPDGRAIAFVATDDEARVGVFVQDFEIGHDTRASRLRLAGFDPDYPTESFGVSPDGTEIVLSNFSSQSALVLAEGVPGIERGAPVK